MQLTFQMVLIVCPLVFLASFIDAIAGGGGLISLPAYLIAGLPTHIALGTNKMSSTIGTIVSTVRYCKNTKPHVKLAVLSVVFSLTGSYIGSSLALIIKETFLRNILVFILPIVAAFVLFSKKLGKSNKPFSPQGLKDYALAAFIAFLVGGYDGFYGPGTGTFLIILFLSFMKMDINTASANTKIVNSASNISAFVVFLLNGKVFFALGLIAIIFSILGNYLGSQLVLKRGFVIVKPIIILVISILFCKLVFWP